MKSTTRHHKHKFLLNSQVKSLLNQTFEDTKMVAPVNSSTSELVKRTTSKFDWIIANYSAVLRAETVDLPHDLKL